MSKETTEATKALQLPETGYVRKGAYPFADISIWRNEREFLGAPVSYWAA